MKTSVIIPAGGIGKRFGSTIPKQFVDLAGVPILIHCIKLFDKIDEIENIVIAVHSEWYSFTKEIVSKHDCVKVKEVVIGGIERQDSVYNALHSKHVDDSEIVLVHDAVRPFASENLIRTVIETADESGAAVPAIKPYDTIKEISNKGVVVKTIDRSKLRTIQTPQGFWTDILKNAYEKAQTSNFIGTDSSSLLEFIGFKVTVIDGEDSNIKITTPFDLKVGELIINEYNSSK